MKILTAGIVLTLLVSLVTQLHMLAEASSSKAIVFAEEATGAIECALHGVPMSECAPELYEISFDDELNNFSHILNEFNDSLVFILEVNDSLLLVTENISSIIKLDALGLSADFTLLRTDTLEQEQFHLFVEEEIGLEIAPNTQVSLALFNVEYNQAIVVFTQYDGPLIVTALAIATGKGPVISALWLLPIILIAVNYYNILRKKRR